MSSAVLEPPGETPPNTTPLYTKSTSKGPSERKRVGTAVETMDFKTTGSDMLGKEPTLGTTEWVHLMLDRECTPVLYMYFAGIAILIVVTAGIIIIVGLQCNWNFTAIS